MSNRKEEVKAPEFSISNEKAQQSKITSEEENKEVPKENSEYKILNFMITISFINFDEIKYEVRFSLMLRMEFILETMNQRNSLEAVFMLRQDRKDLNKVLK